MPKESKYAKTLRELGFKPYSELLTKEDIAEIDADVEARSGTLPSKLPRAQRRRLIAQKILPGFIVIVDQGEPFTFVADELGYEWHFDGVLDLAPFGFHNGLEGFKTGIMTRKKYLH